MATSSVFTSNPLTFKRILPSIMSHQQTSILLYVTDKHKKDFYFCTYWIVNKILKCVMYWSHDLVLFVACQKSWRLYMWWKTNTAHPEHWSPSLWWPMMVVDGGESRTILKENLIQATKDERLEWRFTSSSKTAPNIQSPDGRSLYRSKAGRDLTQRTYIESCNYLSSPV